jgi:hypothetical protein
LLNIIIKISSCYNKDNKNHLCITAITDNEKTETYEALRKVKRIKRGVKQMREWCKDQKQIPNEANKNQHKKGITEKKREKKIEQEETLE